MGTPSNLLSDMQLTSMGSAVMPAGKERSNATLQRRRAAQNVRAAMSSASSPAILHGLYGLCGLHRLTSHVTANQLQRRLQELVT
jgi:hypothetical protein